MIRLHRARIAGAAALVLGVLMIAACEDPSGVGLNVIDFGETDPRSRTVVAEAEMDSLVDATGFVRPQTGGFPERVIAGRVEDPLFGTVEATAYIDVARPLNIEPGFFVVGVLGAFLSLEADYVYGDTLSVATFDVFEVQDNWNPLEFRSDTTLAVKETLLATFEIGAADTLVQVPLNADWVTDMDGVFRGDDFETQFHGFQIRPRDSNTLARGFRGTSNLRLISNFRPDTEADTVSFVAAEIATSVQRDRQSVHTPPELFPLQDGTGEGLHLTLRLDTLDYRAISAGFIRVEADTLLLKQYSPPNFVRPIAQRLAIFGMSEGPPLQIAEAVLDRSKGAYIFSSSLLTVILQDMALDRSRFETLAIGFPRSPSTLSVAPIVTSPLAAPPRAVVIVVPS
jgi:hypothetical protein